MFPNIDGKKGYQVGSLIDRSVLIDSSSKFEIFGILVVNKPSPARTLNSSSVGGEVSNKVINRAERSSKGIMKRSTCSRENTTLTNRCK